jgi:Rrf2 family protein
MEVAGGLLGDKNGTLIDDNKVIFFVDLLVIIWFIECRKRMMCLSQTTGYAIRALSCLDDASCAPHLIRNVAKCSGVSKPYLAKVANLLARHGLIVAKRGYRGGIALARPADEITLLEIVKAVEGDNWIAPCLLGMDECHANRMCPTHAVWQEVSRQLEVALTTATLADVVRAMKAGRSEPQGDCDDPMSPRTVATVVGDETNTNAVAYARAP